MSGRVKTTAEERERIAKQFTNAVTVLYDEYVVIDATLDMHFVTKDSGRFGGTPEPFTSDHIKITQIWSEEENKIAHLGTADDYWKLGIRFSRWRDRHPVRNFTTIVHEAAHLPGWNNHLLLDDFDYDFDTAGVDDAHPLQFWLLFAVLGDRINSRRHILPDYLYDIPVTGGPVICSAIQNAQRYASGIKNAGRWAEAVLDRVDYKREYFRLFGNDGWHQPYRVSYEEEIDEETLMEVPVEMVDYDAYTDAELYDEFEDCIDFPDEDDYRDFPSVKAEHQPKVKVSLNADGEISKVHRVIDGDEALFALLARKLRPTVECQIREL